MRVQKLDVVIALFAAVIIAEWLHQGLKNSWDWDINHMMYFGQRLLAGEFHWTREFDDKLPVLQIIFALPAAFDNFAVWGAMSLGMLLAGALSVFVIIDDTLLRGSALSFQDRSRYGVLGGVSCLYFATFLPGDIYHINAPAAACVTIALATLIGSIRFSHKKYLKITFLLLSAFAASIAVGVRPYFLFSLIAGALWLYCRAVDNRSEFLRACGATATWTFLVGVFGLLVNFAPYLALGNMDAFFAGMSMLRQTLNPQSITDVVYSIHSAFNSATPPIATMIAISVASCFYSANMARSANTIHPSKVFTSRITFHDTIVFSLILPIIILISIVGRHFWPHYLQMFSPFFGIGFALFFAFIQDHLNTTVAKENNMFSTIVLSAAVVFAAPNIALDLKSYFSERQEFVRDQIAGVVSEIRLEQPENKRSFLFVDNMYTHWKLAESRHGFPHAANSIQIIGLRWWINVEMPDHFNHPTNRDDYCSKIASSGPSIIILGAISAEFVAQCMYNLAEYVHYRDIDEYGLSIFVRQ